MNHLCRRKDVGDIRILRLPQWGRDTDDDHLLLGQGAEVGGGGQPASGGQFGHSLGWHVWNVGLPPSDRLDLARIDLKTGRLKPALPKLDHEGQPHIAQSNDSNPCLPRGDPRQQALPLLCPHVYNLWIDFPVSAEPVRATQDLRCRTWNGMTVPR